MTVAATAAPAPALGRPVTFVAAVGVLSPGVGTPTGVVTFKEGSTVLGTGTLVTIAGTPFATFTTSTLSAGVHHITAVYGGDAWDKPSTSATFTVTVGGATPATAIYPAAPAATAPAAPGQAAKAAVPLASPAAATPAAATAVAAAGQRAWLTALEAVVDEDGRPAAFID